MDGLVPRFQPRRVSIHKSCLVRPSDSLSTGKLHSAKDNAPDCAGRAAQIDSKYRARLLAISQPEGVDDNPGGFSQGVGIQGNRGLQASRSATAQS
jgi:hypothetical protein